MDQLQNFGTGIFESLKPTFDLYSELLKPILPTLQEPVEHEYGPHARHLVDVFDTEGQENKPVVVFVHGGGLSQGSKRLLHPEGAYQNVGSFFSRQGFLTLVPNYRLTGADDGAARFPSGAEDLSLLLLWLSKKASTLQVDLTRVFLIGNSAGAVHVTTLLCADSLSSLSPPLAADASLPLSAEIHGVEIKAAVLVSMPAEFGQAVGARKETLEGYFGGGSECITSRCPVGLRKLSIDQTELLIATAELDPQDEILTPLDRFIDAIDALPSPPKYTKLYIKGHNHISVPLGLSVNEEQERWGVEVAEWLHSR